MTNEVNIAVETELEVNGTSGTLRMLKENENKCTKTWWQWNYDYDCINYNGKLLSTNKCVIILLIIELNTEEIYIQARLPGE